ncbi:MAG: M81 family metallopeptidase [Burkholderiaceae bacterium]
MRIFVGGFQHETNTFAPTKADWSAFLSGESFPALTRGQPMLALYEQLGFGLSGFQSVARERGWRLAPSIWAGAVPSAHVTREAFERIAAMFAEDLRAAIDAPADEPIGAIYLDLHGAAVTEHLDDAEGELLARLRAIAGDQVPIVASLDLHANLSERMFAMADALVAYRTYPHVDSFETGVLAARLLDRRLALGRREKLACWRAPFLLPLNVQSTMTEPASAIYRELVAVDSRFDVIASFAPGFPAADIPDCGPAVWAYGEQADAAVRALVARIDAPREQWRLTLLAPNEAVREAMRLAGEADRPVVIADTQDNPGAGADSNTTGMLHALLAEGAGRAYPGRVALGLLFDPAAARAAHAAGIGATVELALGTSVPTWGGQVSDPPVRGRFIVRALSDGAVPLKGAMGRGRTLSLGPCACLEIDGVRVVVGSGKSQMLDREMYRHHGVEPEAMKILVNKSSVHFRADFAPIASHILVGKAAGPMAADPADLPWTRLPDRMALRPC